MKLEFTRFDLHRVWSWCVADNAGSAHVLQKLGMRREGALRENEYYRGRGWVALMFGILADEWEIHKQGRPVYWKELEG